MVEGNERGKQARQYFIACEKMLKEVSAPQIGGAKKVLEALEIFKTGIGAFSHVCYSEHISVAKANALARKYTGIDILADAGFTEEDEGVLEDPRRMLL